MIRLLTWLLLANASLWAAGGSISGTVKDSSGAAVPKAQLTLLNAGLKTEFKTTADARGFYVFPALQTGHYDLTVQAPGFQPRTKRDLIVSADAVLTLDPVLDVVGQSSEVTVIRQRYSCFPWLTRRVTHGQQLQVTPLG